MRSALKWKRLTSGIYHVLQTKSSTSIVSSPFARMSSTFPNLPIFRAIASHDPKSTAIVHAESSKSFTYGELIKDVEEAKIQLYRKVKEAVQDDGQIGGQRIAFMVENGYDYVGARLTRKASETI